MPVPLRANANLRAEAKYNVVTEFPNYDLHSAAASGNQGLAEYALARGQPVNSVVDGVLPLHAACAGGHEQVVKLLLDHGADVNAARLPRRYSNEKNRDSSAPIVGTTGSTPLHFAAANGNKNVIITLLMRGAHADRRDKHGITPAMLAEQYGWLECADVLNNWVKDKDRDLRERVQPDEGISMALSVAQAPSGSEDDIKPNTRKHIQVKRSIDTALNILKAGSTSTPSSKLALSSTSSFTNNARTTSPISPTIARRDFSPSPSEDGRFSPSPSPINQESRRPSLPHIFQTPSSSSQRSQKPATLTKPRNSRRPRSAGTDAEQDPDPDGSGTGFGRGSTGKKLGTKYSLLNLFKKGNESGGVPLERTASYQSSASIPSPSPNSSKFTAILSSSPQLNASPLNENGPLPAVGFRFGGSSSSHTRTSPSTSSLFHQQTYTPPRPSVPLAADLHHGITAQHHRYSNRDRSGSSGSAARYEPPTGLGISFDEADGETAASFNKLSTRRFRPSDIEQHRDRSGSNASNRNGTIFDDEIIISTGPNNGSSGNISTTESIIGGTSKNNSRPSILRGHNRTSSSSQPRALRFDSSTSGSGVVPRRESDAQPPRTVNIPLRGCISAGSLNRFQNERNGSPRLQPMALEKEKEQPWKARVPDSAPANIGDFDFTVTEENEYGHPIQPSIAARLGIQTRNRGSSFTSSESSLSPALSAGDEPTSTVALHADFPFSLDAPPPIDEVDGVAPPQVQLSPPPVDSRMRGDSVSSTSTADSGLNPSLSASATTSGSGRSGTIPTPMVSPEGGSYLNLSSADSRPRSNNEKINVPEVSYDDYLEAGPAQGVAVIGINERRGNTALENIDVNIVSSHAQAEALVQRTQQDILSAHADGHSSSTDSMPLSARLAALGESLELERRLREKKQAEEVKAQVTAELLEDSTSSTARTEILRQCSLDQLSGSVSSSQQIRRPHANSEASRIATVNDIDSARIDRTKLTHHPSLSASVVEASVSSPTFDSDVDSPSIQSKFFDRRANHSRTPDLENDLSRISSLEGFDVDTELGPSLFRVSTAPNSSFSTRDKRERELASNTKLTRMGFSPSENARAPSKRFGGLKSLMQSLKGSK
ncbi:uncharacterized protein C8R40DRAFT_1145246 [Lentinula edodes]|uniref:uncharacterized protein n=1 Tax=Lentinula edodes TaxID=5353 RepID=UPI001BF9A9A8|nr:uncharacterized protein C8R40DRAFT_1145246 [Lentinula edodes]KAF8828787.1 hypothetical protein HHX47_DHR3000322 [Lentinula edodes]KAH7876797.1 hypothetical protein C8R40DRAFT_1145246 [Lentinula edodes]